MRTRIKVTRQVHDDICSTKLSCGAISAFWEISVTMSPQTLFQEDNEVAQRYFRVAECSTFGADVFAEHSKG